MSINAIRTAIESRFVAQWPTPLGTDVRYSNQPFDPPNTGTWASLDVMFRDSVNSEIGYPSSTGIGVKRNGAVLIDLYAKTDDGVAALTSLADTAVGIFENQQFSGVNCLAASITHLGQVATQGTDPEWHVYRVRVPFYSFQ